LTRRLIILAILLLAFELRLIALNTRPIWYDESFAIFLAEENTSTIVTGTAADTMPPLYYFVLHSWIPLVGETPFALRMLSVLFSLLTVSLVYAITTRGFASRAGELAAFFTALAPFQVYYAQLTYVYELLAVGLLIYIYAVMCISLKWRAILPLIVLGIFISMYSHNLAFVTLIAADVYFALRRNWRALFKLVAAQLIAGLAFLPWLAYVPTQIAKIQTAFWTQPPGLVDILQMLTEFTTYLPLPGLELAIALFISLGVCAIVALELRRWNQHGIPQELGLLLAYGLIPPSLMFLISYLIRPVFVPRGAIASSLAYYMVLAILTARMPRMGQIVVIGIAGIIALGTLPFLYSSWGEWRRAPFDLADAYLRAQVEPGDLILHDNKLSLFPMRFYDRTLPQEFVADPPGSSNDTLARATQDVMNLHPVELSQAIQGHPRVWFVIFQTALDQAAADGHPHGNLSQLEATFQEQPLMEFGDLRIFLYATR
jgi:mannosyltransferase